MGTARRIFAGTVAVILAICLLSMWRFGFRGSFVIYLTLAGLILGAWTAITGHAPRTLIFFSFLNISDDDDPENLPGYIVYPLLLGVIVTAAVVFYMVAFG